MSRLGHPFYGLTLRPEDKIRVHTEVFHLIYGSGGAFSHDEAYSMPIPLRYFNLRLLMEQKERESKQSEDDNTSKPKSVVRPSLPVKS